MVVSHSCEIDKKGGKGPVLVAPVLSLALTIKAPTDRDFIRSGRRFAFFYVPAQGTLVEESYVDLRGTTYLRRKALDSSTRVLSSSADGVERLVAHLVAFLTRIDVEGLKS